MCGLVIKGSGELPIVYAKQKHPGAIKKDAAKQSRINAITKYDW